MATPYAIGSGQSAVSSATLILNVATATTAGDAIVVAGANSGTAGATDDVTGVTDSQGNTYTQKSATTTDINQSIWVADTSNNPSGTVRLSTSDTITLTFGSTNTNSKTGVAAGVTGYSGTDVAPAPTANAGSTTPSIASGTLAQASEVIFTAFANGSGGGTPTGLTNCTSLGTASGSSAEFLTLAYDVVSATTSVTTSCTVTSTKWSACLISLKAITSLTGTASLSGQGTLSASPTTGLPSGLNVINQWPVTVTNDYGHQVIPVANTGGNTLVAILGQGSNSQATLPRFNVADDAHNFWTFAGTQYNKTATRNRRVDVWIAPNASPASIVSLSESWFTNGVAGVILEVENFPDYIDIDFIASSGGYASLGSGGGGGGGGNTVTVNGPGTQNGVVGTPVSLTMTGTDSAVGQTLTWSATGLPAGLSINSSTGAITGTPTTAASYTAKVTATDTTSAFGFTTFTWTIAAAPAGTAYLIGTAQAATSSATLTLSVSTATTAGDAIVVTAANSSGIAVSSVTDSKSNTYTQKNSTATEIEQSMWVADSTNNGSGTTRLTTSDTITITYAATNASSRTAVAAGVTGYSGTDVTPAGSGNTATPTIASGTLTQANEITFASFCTGNGGGTPGSFTNCTLLGTASGGTYEYLSLAYNIVSATASESSSCTITSDKWSSLMISLEVVSGGGGSGNPIFGCNAEGGAFPIDSSDASQDWTAKVGHSKACKSFETGLPSSWQGGDVPSGMTMALQCVKVSLTSSSPYISSADQATLASYFGSLPTTGDIMVTINQEGERTNYGGHDYSAAQVAGAHHKAYEIFLANAPSNAFYIQDFAGYSASPGGRGSNFPNYVCCAANGQVDLDGYFFDWYPFVASTTPAEAAEPWMGYMQGLNLLRSDILIGAVECNYTAFDNTGPWYSGGQTEWFQQAWAYAVANNFYCMLAFFDSTAPNPVYWPPSAKGTTVSAVYAELATIQSQSGNGSTTGPFGTGPILVATATVAGTATQSDFAFGALLISDSGTAQTITPPTGFTELTAVETGSSSTDQTSQNLYPLYGSMNAGAFSESWTWSTANHYEAILVGFSQNPPAPTPNNPRWPSLMVQAGFGFQPGDVSQMPVWTDITTRATDTEGTTVLSSARGREYELTQPEAGELDLTLDNEDGAFNPDNLNSPYSPDVLPEVPVQVSAFWQGKQYPIAFAYADKWPQNWTDPQWGQSKFEGSDAVGVASNITLPSAYQGDVLIDQPYAFFPLGEQYNEAAGEPFNNASRTNLIPAYGVDDTNRNGGVALQTGLTFNLSGDSGTGIGISGSSATPNGGPGAYYYDPNMPQLGSGLSVEFWMQVSAGASTPRGAVMVGLEGPAGNYPASLDGIGVVGQGDGSRLEIWADEQPTNGGFVSYTLSDFNGRNFFAGPTPSWSTNGKKHHIVITASYNSPSWTIQTYVDGVLKNTSTTTAVGEGLTTDRMCIGPLVINGGLRYSVDYQIMMVALYGYVLDPTRVLSHYNSGNAAGSGEPVTSRYARLNTWGGQGLPIAATTASPTPFMGPADQIQSQSLIDAAEDLTTADGGMVYCDAQGNLWYIARSWLYNRVPKWTFGDNTAQGVMSDNTNISSCNSVNPAVTQAFFNQPTAFISGGTATTDPRPTGFSQAMPILNYTAYAQFRADVTNAPYTQNSVVYTPAGPINSVFRWVRYDIEGGGTWPTPSEEKADPQTYLGNFITLAQQYGYNVMVTPARDLANTDTVHPQLSGETDDAWYIRTQLALACANANILEVQTQADQASPQEMWWFFTQAREQVQSTGPATDVWAGVSTTYGTGAQMYAAAQTVGIADGIWLNIIGDTTDSIAFMELVLAQPLQAPYIASDLDFSNTFLYNQTASQRTISASQETLASTANSAQYATLKYNQYGALAIEADLASEIQFMPRTVLEQDIETTSDQDAYDRANWSLAKYSQPQLRANQILLDPAANPSIFGIALGVEQGDVVSVLRRPVGAPAYCLLCIVQKVEHNIGPSVWNTTLTLSPYFPEGNVIQLGTAPFSNPANGVLGW